MSVCEIFNVTAFIYFIQEGQTHVVMSILKSPDRLGIYELVRCDDTLFELDRMRTL